MTNEELYELLRDFRKQLVEKNASHEVVLEYTLLMTRLMNKVTDNSNASS
jgi:hypothetical protein